MLTRFLSPTCKFHTKVPYFLFVLILLATALRTSPAQSIRSDSLSAASETGWNALPHRGLDHRVRASAVVGDDLYLAGRFTRTGDKLVTNLNRIARYDTAGRIWHSLPNQGLSDEVTALAVVDMDLYAGGWFTQTVDGALTDLGNIARYDIVADTWHALPHQGLNSFIFALAAAGNDLYVGGLFTQTGDGSLENLNRIARYDTASGTWHALPNKGLSGSVFVLAVDGSDIYVGGNFSQTGDGTVANLGGIARYDSAAGTWHTLSNQGLNGTLNALEISGSDLYVGGDFTHTGDGAVTNLNGIARYDRVNNTWHALPNQGLNDPAFVFELIGEDLYVGGAFDETGDGTVTNLGNIARYDSAAGTWHALPKQGLNNWVYVLTPINSDMYMGGEFNGTGDRTMHGLGGIARYGLFDDKLYLPLVIRR